MIIRNRGTRKRPEQTVHLATIITLLLQGGLRVGDHLIGRQVIVAVDWTVIWIICPWVVALSRIPPARVPVVPSAEHKDDAVIMASPPISIVPLRSVIPKNCII